LLLLVLFQVVVVVIVIIIIIVISFTKQSVIIFDLFSHRGAFRHRSRRNWPERRCYDSEHQQTLQQHHCARRGSFAGDGAATERRKSWRRRRES